ncbi:MAG TPA: hypothetical protein TECP_00708 [Hyphomicrobiaceae bacterium MAG_BT-2024]
MAFNLKKEGTKAICEESAAFVYEFFCSYSRNS